ncbi:MAG: TetR/AcrR family transcriptional regulator [Bacteroidota bacterium]
MSGTKEHILKKAFSLFLCKNFKEVTMKDIVNETGLSKGAFYHYFESKEKLFIEVIDSFYFDKMMIDYKKLNNDSLWNFYHDYVEQIVKSINDFREFLNYNDADSNINYITMMFDALNLFPGFQDKVKYSQREELDAWASVIKKAREAGEFSSPMSDEQIARIFIYSNDGIALYLLLNGKLNDAGSEMLNLWDNFYSELKD